MQQWLKQHRKARKALILSAEVLVFVALYLGIKAYTQRDLASGVAPEIQAVLLSGEKVSLSDYRGQPVLVHFWATWCPICLMEQDSIQAINEDWPVLTVAMQSGDTNDVAKYMREEGLDWATIVDEDGELSRHFGVAGVPASFVLDGSGQVRFKEVGYTTNWGLRARLWLADD